ncbi:hypothetical protein CcaverHIS002_0505570 [Cutaneotrichosporon cavernicola]|nr:hypothetical protein CcaverHIS002_0505570 [Cutaneotrichosporon cavernicola]
MSNTHHYVSESFDRDLFDRSDRDRWRVSIQSLSSLKRSLSRSSNQRHVSSLDTSLALGSPTYPRGGGVYHTHATSHGPRGPSSGYHSYTPHSPPSIASVSAASTTTSAYHRAPPSGPSSPRPDMSYASIPSTALRLDGFDTRMFDRSPSFITNSPLPRVPSPGFSVSGKDKRISVISSVGTETTASRSVRELSDTASPSLSSSTRGSSRHPFYPPDEYHLASLNDFAIPHPSHTGPRVNQHSFLHNSAPLGPNLATLGADHVADLSPTLAPASTIHSPLAPPLVLGTPHSLDDDATPPTTAGGARSRPPDGRVFTPSPNLSPSSRGPTPQGSILSTPFEEREDCPPFGGLPRIPIHPLDASSFGGSGAAGTTGIASLTVPGDDNEHRNNFEDGASNMHDSLRVHKHRGQHSPGPSPEPSPKGSHSPLQSDARSIKSNKRRPHPPMYDGGYLGSPSDAYNSLTHHPHHTAPPSPQPRQYHMLPPSGHPLSRTAPRPPAIDTDLHGYDPNAGPSFRHPYFSQHHDQGHFQPVRQRSNRVSQMTTSSVSSDASSAMSPSGVRPGQPWGLPSGFEKRPTVPTVFEDEPLDDIEYDGATGAHEFGQRTGDWQSDRDSFPRASGGGLQLSHSAPSSSRTYGGPPSAYGGPSSRQHRASTVSNATTSSNKSKGSNHPFAMNRAPSPLLAPPEQLAPPGQAVNVSRSLPSLYDSFKTHATPMPAHQVALVSAEDEQDDAICPLCTESLSFSYRLPGEKPHIVPECGHALHNDCFIECYGRVPPEGSRPTLGVCGMCRQPMVVSSRGQEHGSGKNKLAALMGGDDGPSMGVSPQDEQGDDALEPNGHDERPPNDRNVLVPSISIKSEFPSVRRNARDKQMLTAMLTIEVPHGLSRSLYGPRSRREASHGDEPLPPSPMSATSFRESMMVMANGGGQSHFANIELELRDRVEDYATSGIGSLGHLKLYDILKVRKRDVSGDLQLYLFDYGLVCISEERRSSTLRNLFGTHRHQADRKKVPKTYLKIRGRVHLHHILAVQDTSSNSEHVLTLDVETEDDGHHLFHIYFRDSGSLEMWHKTLVRLHQEAMVHTQSKASKLTGLHAGNRPTRAPPLTPTMAPSFTDFVDSCLTTCGPQCPGGLAFQIPLAPIHTPIDLVIAVSTVPVPRGTRIGRKQLTLRNALQCALACMGPRDRISLVCTELGANGVMRRTPLLNPTHHDSRLRLETFIDMLCLGEMENDEFAVKPRGEERADVATAVNLALDVILSRKAKNPLTGVLVVSDLPEPTSKSHMSMVNARLEAAKIQMHTFGYGKAHEPSPLWAMTNQTSGTYTFVREWHDLRDAIVGCVGGLMSVALTNMKLRLTCTEKDFRVQKVQGAPSAIVHSNGKTVDVDLHVLRHSERREILIEFEVIDPNDPPSPESEWRSSEHPISPIDDDVRSHHSLARKESMMTSGASVRSRPSMRGQIVGGLGMNLMHDENGIVDEVPVLEVDCSFHDPAVGRSAARLTNPVLLTMAVLPAGTQTSATGDPTIVRRRMELVASDMITRSVLAASRKNWPLALNMLRGTKRTGEGLCDMLRQQLAMLQSARSPTGARTRREMIVLHAVEGLAATAQDVDAFIDGIEESREMFEADHRNYAAQQAVVLKTQRSWTMRTPTELHYATPCVQQLIQAGREWKARQGTS